MHDRLKYFTVVHNRSNNQYCVISTVNGQEVASYTNRLAAIIAAIRQDDQQERQMRKTRSHSGRSATKSP